MAFRGPQDLAGGALYEDNTLRHTRKFSQDFYVDIFKDYGVSDVIRLSYAQYDPSVFGAAGIRHHDLAWQGSS